MRTLFETGGQDAAVALLTEPEEVGRLIGVFEAVAREQEWRPGDQLRAYRGCALHLAVLVGGEIVGGLQAVVGAGETSSEAGVTRPPHRRVWPEVGTGDTPTAHVTILALAREYRGRPHLFGSLCVELWRGCVNGGIEQILIEATPTTLRLYRRIGWPLEVIGGLRVHWGEECYLCRMGVADVADSLSGKALHSAAHRALVEQVGRDLPAEVPLTSAARF